MQETDHPMVKRTRGTGRPGQRRRVVRPSSRPAAAPDSRAALDPAATPARPSGSLTAAEEQRAQEIEAQIRAEERATEDAERKARDRARTTELAGPRIRDAAPLHVRAANEYAYVRRDIVRIVRMAVVLTVIVAVLYILINVTGTIGV
jgi:hypothetical protein